MKSGCIRIPEILLPCTEDMTAWAVIACDQHTSDEQYWKELAREIGDKPSSLHLILPEYYLETDYSERTKAIHNTMSRYMREGIFRKLPAGLILVERSTAYSATRYGIVLAVDLECYSYEKGNTAAIRASEATIVERIPPRLKIREGACVELPHIMLLYNDPNDTVLDFFFIYKQELSVVYDFNLNRGGGKVKGYFIEESRSVVERLEALRSKDGLVFVVGDGNHSLATAKAHWDKIKINLSEAEQETHPARFALCEAVNVFDEGIRFEAIHRIVKGVDCVHFAENFPNNGTETAYIYTAGIKRKIGVSGDIARAVAETDDYIADYIRKFGGKVDYIHGEEDIKTMTQEHSDYVGIVLPKMDKSALFDQVVRYGNLPRKTFSMGESAEKRYYIEAKEITR